VVAFLDDLSQLNACDGIGCVDDLAHLGRIGKEGNHLLPLALLRGGRGGEFQAPLASREGFGGDGQRLEVLPTREIQVRPSCLKIPNTEGPCLRASFACLECFERFHRFIANRRQAPGRLQSGRC
jgi:hypothetical protein